MRFLGPLVFVCLFFASGIDGSGMGVVGLGRTVFEPLCCYACLASFWGLQLTCSTSGGNSTGLNRRDHGGGDHGGTTTSASCHATNTAYLESLAYCIQEKCSADGISSSTTGQCWSDVAGDGLAVSSLSSNVPSTVPTIEVSYSATTLNQTSLVNEQFYENSRTTITGYVKQEHAHALYGVILILVPTVFCFWIGFLRLLNRYLPSLSLPRPISSLWSRTIGLPALFGKRHLQKGPFGFGYIPSRGLSLLIVCFIILNAALCVINYPTLAPDTWYTSSSQQNISWIADRTGVLCFANIALAIMFSGRNSPICWITGCNRTDIIAFHRWCARIAVIEGIAHVALYMGNTNSSGNGMFTSSAGIHTVGYSGNYWGFGQIAIGALVIILVVSILPIRARLYEIFLFLHIVLAFVILACLWVHVAYRYRGIFGYETWLIIAIAFWGYDRLLMRPVHLLRLNWKSFLKSSHPANTVTLLPGDEFMKITIYPSSTWNFAAGQHCFLFFPNLKTNPFQSHPFTIASWNDGHNQPGIQEISSPDLTRTQSISQTFDEPARSNTNIELKELVPHSHGHSRDPSPTYFNQGSQSTTPSISFIIRPEKGVTKHLHSKLLESKGRQIKCPSVWIEGPYGPGVDPEFSNADTILAVTGGIGITSILAYLQVFLASQAQQQSRRSNRTKAKRFILCWSVREASLASAIKAQLGDLQELKRKGVEMRILGEQGGGKLDVERTVWECVDEEGRGRRVCVVMCGPGGLADAVRENVVSAIGRGGAEVGLVEESFCW